MGYVISDGGAPFMAFSTTMSRRQMVKGRRGLFLALLTQQGLLPKSALLSYQHGEDKR
jgi:hypothetical protein